jgi:hypothetical protein
MNEPGTEVAFLQWGKNTTDFTDFTDYWFGFRDWINLVGGGFWRNWGNRCNPRWRDFSWPGASAREMRWQ